MAGTVETLRPRGADLRADGGRVGEDPGNEVSSIVGSKIQTTKLSLLLRFYFHDVLEQLKTNFHTR